MNSRRCAQPIRAVAVFGSSRGPASGHVGFVFNHSATHIQLLGGNQNDRVSLAWFAKRKLVAVRWPVNGLLRPTRKPLALVAAAEGKEPTDG